MDYQSAVIFIEYLARGKVLDQRIDNFWHEIRPVNDVAAFRGLSDNSLSEGSHKDTFIFFSYKHIPRLNDNCFWFSIRLKIG